MNKFFSNALYVSTIMACLSIIAPGSVELVRRDDNFFPRKVYNCPGFQNAPVEISEFSTSPAHPSVKEHLWFDIYGNFTLEEGSKLRLTYGTQVQELDLCKTVKDQGFEPCPITIGFIVDTILPPKIQVGVRTYFRMEIIDPNHKVLTCKQTRITFTNKKES